MIILTLGPKLYKYDLHWAIWSPIGLGLGFRVGDPKDECLEYGPAFIPSESLNSIGKELLRWTMGFRL